MCTYVHSLNDELSILQVEAWAPREAVHCAKSLYLNKIIVEGDNNQVIDALSNVNKVPRCIDSIVPDLGKEVVDFSKIYFHHIRREGNRAADFMAS